jgi:glucose/arabinose dehydrogenase/cytochrome c2
MSSLTITYYLKYQKSNKSMNKFFLFAFIIMALAIASSCNESTSNKTKEEKPDSLTATRGYTYFFNKCSGCHNFKQDAIGPQLSGITDARTDEWIEKFVRDPKKVIESGDEHAQTMHSKFKMIMPSFAALPDSEMHAIITFLHTQKKNERTLATEDTNDIKNPIRDSIEVSDVVAGVQFVTQIPASSDQLPLTRIIKLGTQPNADDLYILDLRGKMYKLVNGQPKVYIDMPSLMPKFIQQPGLATGFGSFAFHPEFEKNGLLYTSHAEAPKSAKPDYGYSDSIPIMLQWVLTEWKTDPKSFPMSGTPRELLRIDLPTSIHGMQELSFNPYSKPGDADYGLLYIGIGDGGSTEIGHPLVSELPKKIWGSIIRIDPAGHNSNNGKYGIPASNPFSSNKEYAREVYAYGFRNPHRFSWTKAGQLLGTNIGEHNVEALNIILPGHFYGWPLREGTFMEHFFNDNGKIYPVPADDSLHHITYPVAQFDHDEGTAISGGFEYVNDDIPQLKGKYIFGDIGSGRLFFVNLKDLKIGKQAVIKKWNITMNGHPTSMAQLCNNYRVDLRYSRDRKGNIYLMSKQDGKVYRIVKP